MTDVIASFTATGLDVCTAGDKAAIHFNTAQGRVVVTLPVDQLVAKTRGPVDSNGRPFPAAEKPLTLFQADAAAVPVRSTVYKKAAIYTAMWAELELDPNQNIRALAAKHGVGVGGFHSWASATHTGGVASLSGYRPRPD